MRSPCFVFQWNLTYLHKPDEALVLSRMHQLNVTEHKNVNVISIASVMQGSMLL